MKLVHAADIHLDSPMHGLAAYDTAPVAELRLATRSAFRGAGRPVPGRGAPTRC